jgi:hypothetical protein
MNTAEIVKREMQVDGSFQVRELLTESIRQARQSAHLHSHREVLPFHKRCADVGRVRVAKSDFGLNHSLFILLNSPPVPRQSLQRERKVLPGRENERLHGYMTQLNRRRRELGGSLCLWRNWLPGAHLFVALTQRLARWAIGVGAIG